ncbi:UNVERIFIED_CONTAM: hypothetical protein Sradi_5586400 [Sesamum radiatum]|uniref:Serine aminopeptidase S33 domain-containing protein n=1 Tax=Sesamum radiatum TaxID=300843 RepID=A0AAW2L0U5_SESRA
MCSCYEDDITKHKRLLIENSHGEKLVGILHETGSTELVIICHGFRSSKDRIPMVNLAFAFERDGISAFRFDFAGNGESEGSFQYGNYRREAEDLRSVVKHFQGEQRLIVALIGHSKGKTEYRVTKESLMDRLATDTRAACQTIPLSCRVLTIHGTLDEFVPVEDAYNFAEYIPNHKLCIVEGADHEYTKHQSELASTVLNFVKTGLLKDSRL